MKAWRHIPTFLEADLQGLEGPEDQRIEWKTGQLPRCPLLLSNPAKIPTSPHGFESNRPGHDKGLYLGRILMTEHGVDSMSCDTSDPTTSKEPMCGVDTTCDGSSSVRIPSGLSQRRVFQLHGQDGADGATGRSTSPQDIISRSICAVSPYYCPPGYCSCDEIVNNASTDGPSQFQARMPREGNLLDDPREGLGIGFHSSQATGASSRD